MTTENESKPLEVAPNGLANGNGAAPVAEATPTPPSEEKPKEDIGIFYALRFPQFRWLWLGNACTGAAQWTQQTTLGWVVFDLTGSGALLGAIISVGNLATPFVSPLAGLAADRIRRNHIVAVSQFLLFVNALFLAMAIELHWLHVWNLFVFAIVASVLNGFNMPARQSMVFDVVPRESVPNAVALNNIASNVMRSIGPAVGGALIVLFGPANNFLVQAVAYLLVMITVLQIRLPARAPSPGRRRSFFGDISEGYRWAMGNPQARVLLMMMVVYPLLIIPVHNTLIVIFAKRVLDAGAGGVGIMLSSIGIGGLIGGFIAAAANRVDRRGLLQLASIILCGGSLAAFAVVAGLTHNLWYSIWFLMLSGIGGSVFNTTNQTVVQLVAPDHLRGRITSVLQIQPLCTAIGISVTGALSDVFGATAMATMNGLIAVSFGLLVLMFSPRMRGLRLSRLGDPVIA